MWKQMRDAARERQIQNNTSTWQRRATAASLSTRCPKSSEYRFGKVDWINLKISFLTKDAIIMIQLMTFSWLIT